MVGCSTNLWKSLKLFKEAESSCINLEPKPSHRIISPTSGHSGWKLHLCYTEDKLPLLFAKTVIFLGEFTGLSFRCKYARITHFGTFCVVHPNRIFMIDRLSGKIFFLRTHPATLFYDTESFIWSAFGDVLVAQNGRFAQLIWNAFYEMFQSQLQYKLW